MFSLNANNNSRPQSNTPNSSSLSTQSASEASPKSSHALCENLPKSQQKNSPLIQTHPSDNISGLSASSISSAADSSSKSLVEQRIAAARETLSEIRKRIPGKSVNKSYGPNPPSKKFELYGQPALTDRVNACEDAPEKSSIDKITVANCGDLSFLAWQSLMDGSWEKGKRRMDGKLEKGKSRLGSIDIVEWPKEHLCIVLGQPSTDGKFPDEFSDWDKDAVICDVWANIVCKATDFPDVWKVKMAKWEDRELKITEYGSAPIDGQWVPSVMESPVSEKWLTLPGKAKVRGYISYSEFYKPIYDNADSKKYRYGLIIREMRTIGIAVRTQLEEEENNKLKD